MATDDILQTFVAGEFAYLTFANGAQSGSRHLLDPALENSVGRGMDCHVMLNDPLSSRVHALIKKVDGQWKVFDQQSRNGTYLNGQKIDTAALNPGQTLRIGNVELLFEIAPEPLTVLDSQEPEYQHTIVKDLPLAGLATENSALPSETVQMALAGLRDIHQAQQLLLLYQLSIKLLGCDQPDEVIRVSLDLLRDQTRASYVAFLWLDDEGRLKPKLMLPEGNPTQLKLSESLSELISKQGHAVWINKQQAPKSARHLAHFADALCVPLVSFRTVVGAIQAYMDRGRFQQHDFDFCISLSNIAAVALVRARQQSTLANDYRRIIAKNAGVDELIGNSPRIREMKERIARLSRASGCVLIRGESGAGKELVARAIHRVSPRADRPMLSVNCAAIPAELMESQLFGHKAGAFTGADRDHPGYFQQADSGTLFLDEVGELTLEGQAKLLRILEGHPFLPVGGNKQVTVDVRVIAATNRDLQTYVREKKFREDLFYRLSVFEVIIPPLRERGSDLELLLDHFLQHFKQQHGRPGLTLSQAARNKLLHYHWPGNVRQLRNVIDSAVVLAGGPFIEVDDLGLRDSGAEVELETLRLDYWEKKLISEAVKRSAGSVHEAAKLLGVSRATLYRKLDEYGIDRGKLPAEM
ncbi:MAG: sigma 54-interacting transcriptional regulator [Pirellulales bacterium]|nr:sigma 54-interacting transcriptional regulator [Pirellulales bacterium]